MKVRIECGSRVARDARVWIDDLEVTTIVSRLVLTVQDREAVTLELRIVPEIVEVIGDDMEVDTSRKVLLVIK